MTSAFEKSRNEILKMNEFQIKNKDALCGNTRALRRAYKTVDIKESEKLEDRELSYSRTEKTITDGTTSLLISLNRVTFEDKMFPREESPDLTCKDYI